MRRAISLLYWAPAIACALIIYHYSIVPVPEKPNILQDKLQHIAVFFILAFLTYVALQYTARRSIRTSASIVLHFCLIFAAFIQLNQQRASILRGGDLGGDFIDWIADVGGAALVFIFLLGLKELGSKGKTIYSLLSNGADEQTAERTS